MSIQNPKKYRNKKSGVIVLAVFISAQNYVDAYNEQVKSDASAINLHNNLNPLDAGYALVSEDGKILEHWFKKSTFNDMYALHSDHSEDDDIEEEIQRKGLVYPRIEKSHIDSMMDNVTYDVRVLEGTTTTAVSAILHLGHLKFTLCTEIMACVDPRNFDAELGRKYGINKAKDSARNKLWELEGFHLAKQITADKGDFADRMRAELSELKERVISLTNFVDGENKVFNSLSAQDRALLSNQLSYMEGYEKMLSERVNKLSEQS